ncbi:MAG: hypothetical protein U1E66_09980 [Rhodospirillales bacterium]
MLGPVNLGGAKQRLLPERIPALFFGTAIFAHIFAWAALIPVADQWPTFAGGPGPVLAAVHILTLGVFLCTAMGASLQMLPVILAQPATNGRVCYAIFATLTAGAVLLVSGFAAIDTTLIAAGAVLLLAAVLIYGIAMARMLRAAAAAPLLRRHMVAALAALAAAVVLALALTANYRLGILPDHGRLALAHATLAGFGFMGMMALGLSLVLVPMFAIAESPPETMVARAFAIIVGALVLAVAGELADWAPVTALAALVGVAGAAVHIRAMALSVGRRMRRRLGPEFILIFAAWSFLPLALVLAAALALGLLPPQGAPLLIAVTLHGWLLSLLTGVLQRVLPFLASMQIARLKARPLAPAKLVSEAVLKAHLYGHLVAVAALALGTLLALPALVATAGFAGTVAAGAFAWFAVTVLHRTRTHLKTYPAGWKEGTA